MGDGWWSESGQWVRAPFIDIPPPRTYPNHTRDGKRSIPRDDELDLETRRQIRRDKWLQFLIRVSLYALLTVLGYAVGDIP